MADVQFEDLRQRRDGLGAGVVEAVAGMHFEAEVSGERGAGADALPFALGRGLVAVGERGELVDAVEPGGPVLTAPLAEAERSPGIPRTSGFTPEQLKEDWNQW